MRSRTIMKFLSMTVFVIVLLCCVWVCAADVVDSGECGDDLTWTLYDDGTLVIDGTGEMRDYTSSSMPWYSYRDSILQVEIGDGVTSIGNHAFYWCNSLTSINISDGVTSIGSYAFYGCFSLASITIPNSVTCIESYTFHSCSSLTSIAIPDGVTSIENCAFSYCSSLKSVSVGDTVIYIMSYAFSDCTDLESITIGNSVKLINNYAFSKCTSLTSISIPDSVTSIGGSAFRDCTSLTSVSIGDSVKSIGQYAFCECTSLAAIIIPNNVTYIDDHAFYDCTSLTSVSLGDGVISIGGYAFCNCTSLTSITIGDSVASIGSSAFRGCTSLASAIIGNNVISIGFYAFRDCTFLTTVMIPNSVIDIGKQAFYKCTSLTSVAIGNSVSSIGDNAFTGTALTNVTIPDSVTSIGNSAFEDCSFLTSVTIGNSVTSIGSWAFNNCSLLASIAIPDSVTSIGARAFNNCSLLTSIIIPNSVTDIGDYAFCGCTSLASVIIGNSVTNIGCWAFSGTSITTVTIPESMTSIGACAFSGCAFLTSVAIHDSVTSIGGSAFSSCASLTAVRIPNSVTSIGDSAFAGCTSLATVTMPDSVTSIGGYAFSNCTSLTTVTIPDSVASIEYATFDGCISLKTASIGESVTDIKTWAFRDCTSLLNVIIPNSVTSIGDYVFNGCTSLAYVIIGNSVTNIGSWAFSGTSITSVIIPDSSISIGQNAFCDCTSLVSVTIGNSVISIGASAFTRCASLASVTIGDSVTSIGISAFAGCTSLTSITVPDSVISIGQNAFRSCTSLESVTIGNSVTSIGSWTFEYCRSLTSAYFRGDVPTMGYGVFNHTASSLILYYPVGNTSGWTSPRWDIYNTATWDPNPPFYDAIAVMPTDMDMTKQTQIKITVRDAANNTTLSGVTVTLGESAGTTDSSGVVVLDTPDTDSAKLTLTKDGYSTISLSDYGNYRTSASDTFEMYPVGYTVLIPLTCNGGSINTSTAQINTMADLTAKIYVTGISDQNIVKYTLVQESTEIATSTDGSFSVHNSKFTKDKPVYAWMYTSDGKITKKELNINVVSFTASSSLPFLMQDPFTIALPNDNELFNGVSISFKIDDKIKVSKSIENDNIKFGIGLDVINTDLSKLNSGLRKWMDEHNRKTPSSSFTFDVAGYIKVDVGNKGVGKVTGDIVFTASYKNGFGKTYLVPVVVVTLPIRVEVEMTVKGTIEIKNIGYDLENATIVWPNVDGSISGELSAKGGIGTNHASAGVYGKIKLKMALAILPDFYVNSIKGSGEIGLYAKAKIGFVKGEVTKRLWPSKSDGGELTIYQRASAQSVALYATSAASLYDTSHYTLATYDEMSVSSDWDSTVANGTLQTSVYNNADPQMVTAGDTTMQVFQTIYDTGDSYNYQKLVYSLWNGSGWDEPVVISDNEYVDAAYALYSDGTTIWLAYTQANRSISEADTIADCCSILELYVTKYDSDNATWEEPIRLTNDSVYDTNPVFTVVDGIPTVVWVANLDNNLYGMTENNVIYRSQYTNGAWTDAVIVCADCAAVQDIAAGELNGEMVVAVITDSDSDFATSGDSVLTLYGTTNYVCQSTDPAGLIFCDGGLYWYDNSSIYFMESFDVEPIVVATLSVDTASDFQVLQNGTQKYLLLQVYNTSGENGGSDIALLPLDTDAQSVIQLTDMEGYADSFTANWIDGKLLVVCRRADVTFTEDDMEMQSELRSLYIEPGVSLVITDLIMDEETLLDEGKTTMQITVRNQGLVTVSSWSITVGNHTENYDTSLAAGESTVVNFSYSITSAEETVDVVVSDGADSAYTCTATVGYADFVVYTVGKQIANAPYVQVTVQNNGNIQGSGTLTLRKEEADGDILYSKEITLLAGEQSYVLLEIMDTDMSRIYAAFVADENVHEYTAENNVTYCDVPRIVVYDGNIVYGDVNNDNVVNEEDILILQRYFAGWDDYADKLPTMEEADVDRDGTLTRADLMYLQRAYYGWEGYTLP